MNAVNWHRKSTKADSTNSIILLGNGIVFLFFLIKEK